jgi:hypothetical protein
MPTYSAKGVTATLSLADLGPTLTKAVDSRQGIHEADVKRIGKVFASGKRLRERPIGSDGGERGVLQFIGEHEDLPCFVVEASERSPSTVVRGERSLCADSSRLPGTTSEFASKDYSMSTEDSPLTSLQATPSTGAKSITVAPSHCGTPTKKSLPLDISLANFTTVTAAANELHQLQVPKALVLELETCKRSFPRSANRKRGELSYPDMKIELFMNGQLVNAHFVNYQRLGTDHKHEFSGTRIHKQIDKPWIYQASEHGSSDLTAEQRWVAINELLASQMKVRGVGQRKELSPAAEYIFALTKMALPDRLKDCSNLGILDIVITTGKGSKHGPVRGYLTEPQPMLSTKYRIDQVDLTGPEKQEEKGRIEEREKPEEQEMTVEKEFLEEQAQHEMEEEREPQDEEDPFVDAQLPQHGTRTESGTGPPFMPIPSSFGGPPPDKSASDALTSSSNHSGPVLPSTSPAIPLARRTRSASINHELFQSKRTPASGKPKAPTVHTEKSKVGLLAAKLGIPPEKMSMSRQWHSARGIPSNHKTVAERLIDIRKMRGENQELAIAEVLGAISSDASETPVRTRPRKKARTGKKAQSGVDSAPSKSAGGDTLGSSTNSSLNLDVHTQDAPEDPVAFAAQQRMDMLIDQGASPEGHLAQRVSSLSSHRKPSKKAGPSPPDALVMKLPPMLGSLVRRDSGTGAEMQRQDHGLSTYDTEMVDAPATTETPQKTSKLAPMPPIGGDPVIMPDQPKGTPGATTPANNTSAGSTKKSKHRSRSDAKSSQRGSVLPDEPTANDALVAFKVPPLCQGSVLTYAGPGMQRQITKSRPGTFDEECFVVGMRFVVV